jgi:hypothetical protein
MRREYLPNVKETRYGTEFQNTTEVSRSYIFKTYELINSSSELPTHEKPQSDVNGEHRFA